MDSRHQLRAERVYPPVLQTHCKPRQAGLDQKIVSTCYFFVINQSTSAGNKKICVCISRNGIFLFPSKIILYGFHYCWKFNKKLFLRCKLELMIEEITTERET